MLKMKRIFTKIAKSENFFHFFALNPKTKKQGKYILNGKNIIKKQYFSINILTMHTFCDKIGNVKVNFVIFETDFQENENYK